MARLTKLNVEGRDCDDCGILKAVWVRFSPITGNTFLCESCADRKPEK